MVLSCRPDLGMACMMGPREGSDITPYEVNISFIIWLQYIDNCKLYY